APSAPVDPDAGWWHAPWSPELQARWVGRMFAIAMSKPFVESVFWTELYDHDDAALPRAGLISADGKAKAAFTRLVGARRRLRKPLGILRLPERASS
ncbi:MAG: hypothetical protein HKN62_14890, partial [Phycisphaerales bacterium]|nr:hypothetical protein [Phycisphaerales bacterium]